MPGAMFRSEMVDLPAFSAIANKYPSKKL